MKIDLLVAEIGSTTTVVNGFHQIHTKNPIFLGSGFAPTSVLEGDVRLGLNAAIKSLKQKLSWEQLEYEEMFATSSAAGGLKMSVHGLVYDMTVKAAKEAALGAGAIIHQVTAGKLRRTDLEKLAVSNPNIILIAGGVDYGERETALDNAEKIAELKLNKPVIYAGNVENWEEMKLIFAENLYLVDNVFPKIDELHVEPTRKVIQEVFEKNIIYAPGMEHVFELVTARIMPTPAAVMKASELVYEHLGDVLVVDVGGATTDIHSVTDGDEAIARLQVNPEPVAKRTVEGDLGVYVNGENVMALMGGDFDRELLKQIPGTAAEKKLSSQLTAVAASKAVERHVGKLRYVYGPTGRQTLAEGKDLTKVKYVIGTGGALTRLHGGMMTLNKIVTSHNPNQLLLPGANVEILLDHDYIMASVGVLSLKYPEAALSLLKQSLYRRG